MNIFLLAILTHHVFSSPRSISHIHHRSHRTHTVSICIYHEIVYYSKKKNRKKHAMAIYVEFYCIYASFYINFCIFFILIPFNSATAANQTLSVMKRNRMFWQMWSSTQFFFVVYVKTAVAATANRIKYIFIYNTKQMNQKAKDVNWTI